MDEAVCVCLSSMLSFEDFSQWDAVAFVTADSELNIARGNVGVSKGWLGSLKKLDATTKFERSAEAINGEFVQFGTRGESCHTAWTYNYGLNEDPPNDLKKSVELLVADSCAEAQLTGRLLARNFLKEVKGVSPDCPRLLRTSVDKATQIDSTIKEIRASFFLQKYAPAKMLVHSSKERGKMDSYQIVVLEGFCVQGGSPSSTIKGFRLAKQRWESCANSCGGIAPTWVATLHKMCHDSQVKDLKKDVRSASSRACKAWGNLGAGTLICFLADYYWIGYEVLNVEQGDYEDVSFLRRRVDELDSLWEKCSINGEIIGPKGRHTFTQITLESIKSKHMFHYGEDGVHVASLGWTGDIGILPGSSQRAPTRFKTIVRFSIELIRSYYDDAIQGNYCQAFDSKSWNLARRSAINQNKVNEKSEKWRGSESCTVQPSSVLSVTMGRWLVGPVVDAKASAKDQWDKICWIHVLLGLQSSGSPVQVVRRSVAAFLAHQASSCANERDIRKILEFCKLGKHEQQTIRDIVLLRRWGPTHIQEFVQRTIDVQGNIVRMSTPFLLDCAQMWEKLFGHRHACNTRVRCDKGEKQMQE